MEDPTGSQKSLALPIAAGFLIGTAVWHLLQFIWGEIWRLHNVIDWDMMIKLSNRIQFNCGGCISVVGMAVLALGAAFALIRFSQK